MRQFVLIGHDVPTEPDFSLDDLAGGPVASTRSVSVDHRRVRHLPRHPRGRARPPDRPGRTHDHLRRRDAQATQPDERSTAALVRKALEHREDAIGALPAEPSPGIEVYRRGFEGTLEEIADDGPIVQLHEDGEAVVDVGAETLGDAIFVLSDHRDFTDEEAGLLEAFAEQRLRLGPELLHADQAITIAHHYLDTDGYERF